MWVWGSRDELRLDESAEEDLCVVGSKKPDEFTRDQSTQTKVVDTVPCSVVSCEPQMASGSEYTSLEACPHFPMYTLDYSKFGQKAMI